MHAAGCGSTCLLHQAVFNKYPSIKYVRPLKGRAHVGEARKRRVAAGAIAASRAAEAKMCWGERSRALCARFKMASATSWFHRGRACQYGVCTLKLTTHAALLQCHCLLAEYRGLTGEAVKWGWQEVATTSRACRGTQPLR